MVQTQGVEARPLEYREVADLRCERLIARWRRDARSGRLAGRGEARPTGEQAARQPLHEGGRPNAIHRLTRRGPSEGGILNQLALICGDRLRHLKDCGIREESNLVACELQNAERQTQLARIEWS